MPVHRIALSKGVISAASSLLLLCILEVAVTLDG